MFRSCSIILLTLVAFPLCVSAGEKPYLSSGAHAKLIDRLSCQVDDPDTRAHIKPRKYQYGKSAKGKPLIAYIVEPAREAARQENLYLMAAQHGDERNTRKVLEYFVREIRTLSADYRNERRVIVIPVYNPDGYRRNNRLNSAAVDLNRDFPSSDGDETNPKAPETEAFMALMEKYPPKHIYNLHQPFRVVLYYPEDLELAKTFAQLSDYPLGQGVGYPTPGSLGTYAREKKIPIITVELSRSMRAAMAPFIYEEVRLALFNAAFGCIPQHAKKSRLETYLAE
ncbi:MAG: succinylglutamate desuccinylase/aspartoacylase family protein [Leptospiraceae bacterium]|nr:succinylglutamate desuccinylase/aspartoacylase family protein [Leptospiraceae bacterium]